MVICWNGIQRLSSLKTFFFEFTLYLLLLILFFFDSLVWNLNLFSKIIPSFFTIKEGSTSHLGLLQWSLHPLRFPRLRGTETSGKKRETALLGAQNRFALRLADQSGLRHGCAGWDRRGNSRL